MHISGMHYAWYMHYFMHVQYMVQVNTFMHVSCLATTCKTSQFPACFRYETGNMHVSCMDLDIAQDSTSMNQAHTCKTLGIVTKHK